MSCYFLGLSMGLKEENVMFASNDRTYYLDRESDERALADAATDPAVKAIHEELAARYHGLAVAAEFSDGQPVRHLRVAAG